MCKYSRNKLPSDMPACKGGERRGGFKDQKGGGNRSVQFKVLPHKGTNCFLFVFEYFLKFVPTVTFISRQKSLARFRSPEQSFRSSVISTIFLPGKFVFLTLLLFPPELFPQVRLFFLQMPPQERLNLPNFSFLFCSPLIFSPFKFGSRSDSQRKKKKLGPKFGNCQPVALGGIASKRKKRDLVFSCPLTSDAWVLRA